MTQSAEDRRRAAAGSRLESARLRRAKELFGDLLEEAPEERARLLNRLHDEDPAVAAEVRSLLAAHERGAPFLEKAVERERLELAAGALFLGRRLGPWEIVRRLGEGGMGAVFLARRADGAYEADVAVKLVRPGLASSEEALRRFAAERQTLAALDHPNIARLLDGGTTPEGWPYLVMEYAEGRPVDEHCDAERLSVDERLELFLTVCDAVQHAHRNLVVHRDLKPDNVLVTPGGRVKLLDFGIAKLLRPEDDETALTHTGRPAMTLRYASPEQVRGEAVTTSTDVYGLGLLLYRLLSGHHAHRFSSSRPAEVERAITEETPEPPSTAVAGHERAQPGGEPGVERLRRRLRGDLDRIVLMALRKEPERRYASVEALAEDVRRHLDGLPVRARGEAWAYRMGRFVRRHRGAVAAAALVAVSLLGGLAAATWQARRAAHQAERAEIERAKAEEINRFLQTTLGAADATWRVSSPAAGAAVTVAEVLEAASGRVGEELADRPAVAAAVRRTLGNSFRGLGRYEKAERELLAAVKLLSGAAGASVAELGLTLHDLGVVRYAQGDLEAAEADYRRALRTYRGMTNRSEREEEGYTVVLNDLGILLWVQGRLSEGEELISEALAINRRRVGPDHVTVAIGLGNLGLLRDSRGDLGGAERYYREALETFDRIPGRPPAERAWTLINLGGILKLRRQYDRAEELLRESLEVWRKSFGPDHPNAAYSWLHLADLHRRTGRLAEAEKAVRRTLGIFRSAVQPDHPDLARAEVAYGRILTAQGRYAEGEERLRRAFGVQRDKLGPDHWRLGETMGALGECLLAQGLAAEARPLLQQSHELLRGAMGEEHPRTLEARDRFLAASRQGMTLPGS